MSIEITGNIVVHHPDRQQELARQAIELPIDEVTVEMIEAYEAANDVRNLS